MCIVKLMVYSQMVSWEIILVVPFLGKKLIYVFKYILSKHFNHISHIDPLSDVAGDKSWKLM